MFDTVQRVKDLAAEKKMSLKEFCEYCGVNYTTVSTTAARNGQLRIDTVERFCEGVCISLSDFFAIPLKE